MPEYQTPGIYVEEVSSGARPIQAVGTRTAGFVGVAPNARRYVNKPVAVNNWAEFVRRFATGDPSLVVLQKAVDDQVALEAHIQTAGDKVDNLSEENKVLRNSLMRAAANSRQEADKAISDAASQIFPATNLSMAVYGFFLNGGSRCYVVNVGSDDSAMPVDELAATAFEVEKHATTLATTAAGLATAAGERGKTAAELVMIADRLAKSADDTAKTAKELTNTVAEVAMVPSVPAKTAEDLTKTAEELTKTAGELTTRANDLATTTGAPAKNTTALAKTAEELTTTANELAKTAGVPAKTAEHLTKTAEKLTKTAGELAKTAGVPAKTAEDLTEIAKALNKTARALATAAGDTKKTAMALATAASVQARSATALAKSKPRKISSRGTGEPVGLDILAQIDEVAIVAAPGYTTPDDYADMSAHCETLSDRVAILDGPSVIDDNAMHLLSGESYSVKSADTATWKMPGRSERGFVSLYVPWIEVSNPAVGNGRASKTIFVPPSGHIAGVWARSDATRGVHKAPANEIVRGALGLAMQITHEDQGRLNQMGVNAIRFFPNEGFLVWGARTLSKDPAFRYLNVRRLFNMIEESIAESTRWIVFEPNDRPLWKAIRRDVTAFLMGFWRDGALMGRTPEEAFYVKCDEETNPIESIREGKVIIEVGLAPVLPAEFVIFRISQYEAGTEVELQS